MSLYKVMKHLMLTFLLVIVWSYGSAELSRTHLIIQESVGYSITKSLRETYRIRHIQEAHNQTHNITPTRASSNVKSLDVVRTDEELSTHREFQLIRPEKVKRLKRITKKEKAIIADELRSQLDTAITEWRFEDAALIRDQLKELSGE